MKNSGLSHNFQVYTDMDGNLIEAAIFVTDEYNQRFRLCQILLEISAPNHAFIKNVDVKHRDQVDLYNDAFDMNSIVEALALHIYDSYQITIVDNVGYSVDLHLVPNLEKKWVQDVRDIVHVFLPNARIVHNVDKKTLNVSIVKFLPTSSYITDSSINSYKAINKFILRMLVGNNFNLAYKKGGYLRGIVGSCFGGHNKDVMQVLFSPDGTKQGMTTIDIGISLDIDIDCEILKTCEYIGNHLFPADYASFCTFIEDQLLLNEDGRILSQSDTARIQRMIFLIDDVTDVVKTKLFMDQAMEKKLFYDRGRDYIDFDTLKKSANSSLFYPVREDRQDNLAQNGVKYKNILVQESGRLLEVAFKCAQNEMIITTAFCPFFDDDGTKNSRFKRHWQNKKVANPRLINSHKVLDYYGKMRSRTQKSAEREHLSEVMHIVRKISV